MQIVRVLLEAGARPNAKDRWGAMPYDDAVRKGNRAVIELLEEHVRVDRAFGGACACGEGTCLRHVHEGG